MQCHKIYFTRNTILISKELANLVQSKFLPTESSPNYKKWCVLKVRICDVVGKQTNLIDILRKEIYRKKVQQLSSWWTFFFFFALKFRNKRSVIRSPLWFVTAWESRKGDWAGVLILSGSGAGGGSLGIHRSTSDLHLPDTTEWLHFHFSR